MSESPLEKYNAEMISRVSGYRGNGQLQAASSAFFEQIGIGKADYVYNFTWLGVPVIQIPQDLHAFQEIIWKTKPDLIIETGIAWGGSLVFSASMLAILEVCGEIEKGHVIGIDCDIRAHNKKSLAEHPISNRMTLLEGSSISKNVIDRVRDISSGHKRVMVFLDSNHTHAHVLAELEAYAPIVSKECYCVVGDTIIEDAPSDMCCRRPWGKGNSPKSAVSEYMRRLAVEGRSGIDNEPLVFEIDSQIEDKIVLTGSPGGYLRRV